jgi:CheY-like chemotaxis protein
MHGDRATILVVDDDEDVLDVAANVLEAMDYQVVSARSGSEALSIIRSDGVLDLMLTDIVMPGGIDGWELATQAKSIRPELKIIYTSGYSTRTPPHDKGPGLGPLLPKPWKASQLHAILRSILKNGQRR